MDPDSNTATAIQGVQDCVFARSLEMNTLTAALPLTGINGQSKRVFNVWGENGVGKSFFIKQIRESELMENRKVLWLRIEDDGSIDTVQEFIKSCARHVRYPANPSKEKDISKRIERAQRGKVDPMKSDDNLLITRSSIADQKKPYINQAAAASVGRTEIKRQEVQINMGFKTNELNSQAEAFLDALPLQSLGTDLILIHFENLDGLSILVRDWIKDYLIPSATKGSFRRNLAFIIESQEPTKYHHDTISWGVWKELTSNHRLYPLSEDAVYELAIQAGVAPSISRFIYVKSQGYPRRAADQVIAAKHGSYTFEQRAKTTNALSGMTEEDQAKLAACCLPDKLYPDELDSLFGKEKGVETLKWICSVDGIPLHKDSSGKALVIDDDFRHIAIECLRSNADFKKYRSLWAPYGRLLKFAPQKAIRSKLLLLSGIEWMDKEACEAIFGEKADLVQQFVDEDETLFIRKRGYHRIHSALKADASKVAHAMEHVGITRIQEKATKVWNERNLELQNKAADLKKEIQTTQEELNSYTRRHAETSTQLRKFERRGVTSFNEGTIALANKSSKLPLILLLAVFSVIAISASQSLESPYDIVSIVCALAATGLAIGMIPSVVARSKAKALYARSLEKDSPEHLHKETLNLHNKIQHHESTLDDLQTEFEKTKDLLDYSYI